MYMTVVHAWKEQSWKGALCTCRLIILVPLGGLRGKDRSSSYLASQVGNVHPTAAEENAVNISLTVAMAWFNPPSNACMISTVLTVYQFGLCSMG